MFGEMIWLQEGGCVGKARKRVLGNVGAIIAVKMERVIIVVSTARGAFE